MKKLHPELKEESKYIPLNINILNKGLNNMTFDAGVSSQQIEYFRRRLLTWRSQLAPKSPGKASYADKDASLDFKGKAANTTNSSTASQSLDREQKLIHKINETLHNIEAGTYDRGRPF